MKTSETIDKLALAFVEAQALLKNAVFDKENPHFRSRYATLAGMRDSVTPILSQHGLAVIQGCDMDCIVTRLIHQSGQWVESRYPFAMDKPQQMGSAFTYARRYSLAAICGIASEEDDDGNAAQEGKAPEKFAARKPLQTVTGEAAKPKAQSREVYSRISAGIKTIRDTGSIDDLNAWYKSHVKDIEAMPEDWHMQIMHEFSETKDSIKAKEA
jgi:hypothetical protein